MNVARRHMLGAACVVALLSGAAGVLRGAHLRGEMRPEVVADLLSQVGHSWVHERIRALQGQVNDDTAMTVVGESCGKITSSIVSGSAGDPAKVREYMRIVCADSHGNQEFCVKFAAGIDTLMQGDMFFNRESLDFASFCQHFYNGALTDYARAEKAQQDKEEAARAEVEKRRREAELNAAEERRRAEERQQREERQEADDAARAAQLQDEAERSAARAAEAKVAAQREAAEAMAKVEAQKHEEEANGTAAVNTSSSLANATVASATVDSVAEEPAATEAAFSSPNASAVTSFNATAATESTPNATVVQAVVVQANATSASMNSTQNSTIVEFASNETQPPATNVTPTVQANPSDVNATVIG